MTLQERVQVLVDREAVLQLQHRLWSAVQLKDEAGIQSCLTEDATCDWNGQSVRGREPVTTLLRDRLGVDGTFWGHRAEVDIAGDEATGRWLVYMFSFDPEHAQVIRTGLALTGRFTRVGGDWRIASSNYRTEYVARVPAPTHTVKQLADKAAFEPRAIGPQASTPVSLDLEATAQKLEDIDALRRLKYKYWESLDAEHWEGLNDVFTPDATSGYQNDVYNFKSRAEIVKWLQEVLGGRMQRAVQAEYAPVGHLGRHAEIDLTGPSSAVGTWLLSGVQGGEYYHDQYVKVGGRWLTKHIAQKTNFRALASHSGITVELGTAPAAPSRAPATSNKGTATGTSAVPAQLQRLLDIEDIKRLKHATLRCLDMHEWEGLRACFASRVSLMHGTMLSLPDVTGEEIVQTYERLWTRMAPGGLRSMLLADHPIIEVTGEGQATGRWSVAMFGVTGRTSGGWCAIGPCEERYVRENGAWRIASTIWQRRIEANWPLPGLVIKDRE